MYNFIKQILCTWANSTRTFYVVVTNVSTFKYFINLTTVIRRHLKGKIVFKSCIN